MKTTYRDIEIDIFKGRQGYNAQVSVEETPCVVGAESEYMARIQAENHVDYLIQKEFI
jgi:hypothetical protein